MAILVAGVIIVIVCFFANYMGFIGRRYAPAISIFVSLIMMIWISFNGEERLTQIAVTIEAYEFPLLNAGPAIEFGGSENSDLKIKYDSGKEAKGIGKNAFNIEYSRQSGALSLTIGQNWNSNDILSVDGALLNSHVLRDGDRLVKLSSTGQPEQIYEYHASLLRAPELRAQTTSGGSADTLTLDCEQSPESCVKLPARGRAVSLNTFSRSSGAPLVVPSRQSGLSSEIVLRSRSFRIEPADGGNPVVYQDSINLGARADIRFIRLASVELSSFTVSADKNAVRVVPWKLNRQVIGLSRRGVGADQNAGSSGEETFVLTTVARIMETTAVLLNGPTARFADAQAIVRLPAPDAQDGLLNRLLHWTSPAAPQRFTVYGAGPLLEPQFGQPFAIGDANARISLTIERVKIPVSLVLPFSVILLAGAVYCIGLAPRLEIGIVMAVGCFLACVRFLLGLTADLFPPFHSEAMGFSVLAAAMVVSTSVSLGCISSMMRASRQGASDEISPLMAFFLTAVTIAVAAVAAASGMTSLSSNLVTMGMVYMGLAVVAPLMVLWFAKPLRGSTLRHWLVTVDRREATPIMWMLSLVVAVFALRYLAGAAGIKEAVYLGSTRLSSHAIYVPVLLAVMALLIAAGDRLVGCQAQPVTASKRLAALGGITLIFYAAIIISAEFFDGYGIVLFAIPVAILSYSVFFTHVWRHAEGLRSVATAGKTIRRLSPALLTYALPAIALTGGILYLLITPPVPSHNMSTVELRLLELTNPAASAEIGTIKADQNGQQFAMMRYYSHSGPTGLGFLANEKPIPDWSETALNDNAVSFLLMNQFGTLAAMGVILGTAALLCTLMIPLSDGNGQPYAQKFAYSDTLAALAALAVVIMAAYAVAGNIGLVPFTGRNVFMLGIDSGSDILEFIVLSILILQKAVVREFLS